MIFNIGVDIEEVSRFKNKDKKLLEKIFTEKELGKMKSKSPMHIAGIFSAKEAIIKAYNPIKKLQFNDIEIFNNKYGSPCVYIKQSKTMAKDLKVSISHTKSYAFAAAILLR